MSTSTPQARLFTPVRFRGFESRNRIMISPMQQYAATREGLARDYHIAHLGRFAFGGAGMVIAEATAIEARGRNTYGDLGLWSDAQVEPLARVTAVLRELGAVPGIQLVHCGRKAAIAPPWDGGMPLGEKEAARGDPPWPVVGPSALPAGPTHWQTPAAMSVDDIRENVRLWADAAKRAVAAGFDIIDLHGAHGYLLHSFLSPLSNQRDDQYGGSRDNRMRFPLEVVDAIRAAIPERVALFYRLSLLDGIEGGWTLEDSVVFCRQLYQRGVDLVDCSSGGAIGDRSADTRIRRGYAFHAPYSQELRRQTGGAVATVGLIVDPRQAEAILQAGDADVIAVGREALVNPNWAHHARTALRGTDWSSWNKESGWWLKRRGYLLKQLAEEGETPMTRYEAGLQQEDRE